VKLYYVENILPVLFWKKNHALWLVYKIVFVLFVQR